MLEVYVEAKLWKFGAGSGAELLDAGMSCLFRGQLGGDPVAGRRVWVRAGYEPVQNQISVQEAFSLLLPLGCNSRVSEQVIFKSLKYFRSLYVLLLLWETWILPRHPPY